ncbi:calcium-binding protein [Dongia sp.]|uniref:calcium-binding protein n=1 Tax=Dongia sp. TaxID=1977262 RepID=UPI003752483B
MANFTTSPNNGVDFNNFDIDDLIGNFLFVANATNWRTGPSNLDPSTYVEVQGVGLTYSNGALTGGTITSITSIVTGAFDFQIANLSLSAASFNAYRLAGDSQGFLAAVFNGDDTITGSNQDDTLMGYAGNDKLNGNNGDDYLDGGAGSDTMTGGKGDDVYVIDSLTDVIVETGGDAGDAVLATVDVNLDLKAFDGIEDVMLLGAADLSIAGDASWNALWGNEGNNTILGKAGNDDIFGAGGKDVIDGGIGADTLWGGLGDDTYYVDNPGDVVTETESVKDGGGADTVISTKDFALSAYVENLTLTGGALVGTGNALANTLIGNTKDNTLDGGTGYDTMIGGDGNDTYMVNNSKDVVVETSTGGTFDTVLSEAFAYTLPDYVENLTLRGNAGISGTGNDAHNMIIGNKAANKIDGAGGSDWLFGGDGADTLIGGDGDDWMRGEGGNDTIDVSAGNDVVSYASKLDGFDIILGFDGDKTGGQDYLDLNLYFDKLGVDVEDREARVGLVDNGAVVDVWIDTDGNNFLDTKIAEIHTTDTLKVGEDVATNVLF